MKVLIPIISVLIFIYCNPYKKAVKTIENSATIKTDTIHLKETLFVKEKRFDTSYIFKKIYDTLSFKNKITELKIYKYQDTFHIKLKVNADTIYYNKSIPYNKITVEKTNDNAKIYLIFISIILFLLFVIFIIFMPKLLTIFKK